MEYTGLTICTFMPLFFGYFLYKIGCYKDVVIISLLVGFLMSIYWSLITVAVIIYGIKKYIEIGDMQLFLEQFLRSCRGG